MKRISGHGRGKGLGAPTLNLDGRPDWPFGVHAVWVLADGLRVPGVANWGPRPTFDETEPVLEVHLLEPWPEAWVGEEDFQVETVGYLREIVHFSDVSELSQQITRDVAAARLIMGAR